MQVKIPLGVDISHWKEVKDFSKINPRPVLFITKASEAYPGSGYTHTDEKFIRFFSGAMSIGCTRGAFHFFRKSLDAVRQADHFLKVISSIDILPTDLLILDVEEGGEKAPQLWAWFDRVQKAYPENRVMLYGRKNLLDPIIMTQSEKDYFKQIPTWPAGYPYFPDTFSKIPVGYTPDQTKYGEPWLWQYSSHGRVDGITTELGEPTDVDLNWISPKLYAIIGDSVLIGEKIVATYKGTAKETAKVFASIGGARVYPDVSKGSAITADAEQTVAGVKYIHLTSPVVGWSKATWFTYSQVSTPPPVDPPPPVPSTLPDTLYIATKEDMSDKVKFIKSA